MKSKYQIMSQLNHHLTKQDSNRFQIYIQFSILQTVWDWI